MARGPQRQRRRRPEWDVIQGLESRVAELERRIAEMESREKPIPSPMEDE